MRISTVAIFSMAVASLPAAGASPAPVYLDKPGALESLERENPEHFRRITDILRTAAEMPCHGEAFGRTVAAFDARDAACSLLLMTSLPAKRRLSFVIDQTRYITIVRMKTDGTIIPVDG